MQFILFNASTLVLFHWNGKKRRSSQFIREIINNAWKLPTSPIASISGKVLERLIFNEMFGFLIENNLISSNQSGFKPGDSCINQLLSITHKIYKSFDNGFEVRGVFLDISKAFDKAWYYLQTKTKLYFW